MTSSRSHKAGNGHARFLLVGAGLWLLFAAPLWSLLLLGKADSHYTHTLVVPLAAAYLLFSERRQLRRRPPIGRAFLVPLAAGLVCTAVALSIGGQWAPVNRLALQIAGLVLLSWSAFLWSYGRPALIRHLFPLGLLALMVPFPTFLLDPVVYSLQVGSAEVTNLLFALSGVPFFREDLIFSLPGVTIVIAPECSGIRSSMALTLTGLIASYWFLSQTWSRATLLLLLFPLAVFKNGLRIATLTLLSIWVDPGFLSGGLHNRGGYVFFLISLAVMGGIVLLLGACERRRQRRATSRPRS